MLVYLDNSATSWPKPLSVIKAINNYLTDVGASPGRSGHQLSVKAAREVFETRELLAKMFNVPGSDKVIFTSNATHALNIVFKGILKRGHHVLVSSMEHNSVIRPLRFMEKNHGIELTIVDCDSKGNINLEKLEHSFQANTKLVTTIHGSNVTGTIFPIRKIGEICKKRKAIYLVDAAQSAGILPIDMEKDNIHLLAFTGHKKLYGPPGIGGLCIRTDIEIEPLIQGGTGSSSENEIHPDFYPDHLEAGTLNTVGVIGLKAGIQYILQEGINNLREKQTHLVSLFMRLLTDVDKIQWYGPSPYVERLPIISIGFSQLSLADIANKLDKDYGIMVRVGLQCSPLAHRTLGTYPVGTLRFSFGAFNTEPEVRYTVESLKKIILNLNHREHGG